MDAAARLEAATAERSRVQGEAASAQQVIVDLTRDFREAQRKLLDVDRQLTQRTARLRLLQQLQEKWEGFGEGAKAVLQGRLADALAGAKVAPILQGLAVKPEYGKAVEALLGSAAEAITVSDVGTARRILDQLDAEQIGSVCLQVGAWAGSAGVPPAQAAMPDEAVRPPVLPATAALDQFDPAHPAAAVLRECYVTEDLGGFLEYWQAHPDFSFLAVATRKGDLVDRRGLVYGGHHSSKRAAHSIVQREIELRETAKALVEDQHAHDQQKAVIDALNLRLAAAEQALEQRRAEVLSVSQTLAAVQAEQRNAQRQAEDVDTRLGRMESELVSLERARNEAHVRWEKAQVGLAEADAAATAQREKIRQLETRIVEVRTDRDVKRESLGQARLELAERRQKVEVLDRGLGEMERRRQQLGELLVQRQTEIEAWTEQIAALEGTTTDETSRAAQLAETLTVAQEQVEKVRVELAGLERAIYELESAQHAVREQSDAAFAELSTHEVRLAENRQRARFLTEDVAREFQIAIDQVDWRRELWRADDEPEGMLVLDLDEEEEPAEQSQSSGEGSQPAEAGAAPKRRRKAKVPKGEPTAENLAALDATDWAAIKAEVDALRQRLNSMGAVNLVAIEEYAELKQRHDFLLAQVNDLTTAKAELIQAIDEINQTSQEQFNVTFEQIKKNFEYTFQTLFGGGRAQLELVVAEDILESGIEIVAQPPGTKLKGITLLSGGQKTLTAVALLFALYMVKPSPFCLLDELDAPLDESNIGRFTDLLKKFVSESQFIIITHNKRTVSAASAIYGVTMEERGVSKTVSMRFNHERGEPEAATRNLAESVTGAGMPVPA